MVFVGPSTGPSPPDLPPSLPISSDFARRGPLVARPLACSYVSCSTCTVAHAWVRTWSLLRSVLALPPSLVRSQGALPADALPWGGRWGLLPAFAATAAGRGDVKRQRWRSARARGSRVPIGLGGARWHRGAG